jgi:hypothetical protein
VEEGEELTIDYRMTVTRAAAATGGPQTSFETSTGRVTDWTALPAAAIAAYLESVPIDREVEEDIHSVFAPKTF